MISAAEERAAVGSGERFADSVSIEFCAHDEAAFGLLRLVRLPHAGASVALAQVCAGSGAVVERAVEHGPALADWGLARSGGVELSIAEPLERFGAALEAPGGSLRLQARATSPPLAFGDGRYEQFCDVEGEAHVAGRTVPIRGPGRRVHEWGERDWRAITRRRSIWAVADNGRAVTALATLPAGSAGHDEERRHALAIADAPPLAFDEVRLSAVHDRHGHVIKAGLELYFEGDELPRRMSGEALCSAEAVAAGQRSRISFGRWSLDGIPALGCFETVSAA